MGMEQRVAVDPHLARFDAACYSTSFDRILRVHVSGEAIFGVVGELNGVSFRAWRWKRK
jgi:hypothetical protein